MKPLLNESFEDYYARLASPGDCTNLTGTWDCLAQQLPPESQCEHCKEYERLAERFYDFEAKY